MSRWEGNWETNLIRQTQASSQTLMGETTSSDERVRLLQIEIDLSFRVFRASRLERSFLLRHCKSFSSYFVFSPTFACCRRERFYCFSCRTSLECLQVWFPWIRNERFWQKELSDCTSFPSFFQVTLVCNCEVVRVSLEVRVSLSATDW